MEHEISLDYLAGLIDGEGCITILGVTKGRRNHALVVDVTNTFKPVIELIHKQYKGNFHTSCGKNRDHYLRKTLYSVRWYGDEAKNLLLSLIDKLVIKQEQAKLAIRYPVCGKGLIMTENIINVREELYKQVKELNNKDRIFWSS